MPDMILVIPAPVGSLGSRRYSWSILQNWLLDNCGHEPVWCLHSWQGISSQTGSKVRTHTHVPIPPGELNRKGNYRQFSGMDPVSQILYVLLFRLMSFFLRVFVGY
jgi:hypothetical protein